MKDERNWRDAKIPNWVKDAVERELYEWKITAALSWPQEVEPEPLPFKWGEYDRQIGEPREGVFWRVWPANYHSNGSVEKVHIRLTPEGSDTWKRWQFSSDGLEWSATVTRGPLYSSERDARLALVWSACRASAEKLARVRRWT